MRYLRLAALPVLLIATTAASAQVTGLPVMNDGLTRGVVVGMEVGFPDQDYGNGTAFGLRASVGSSRLGLSGVISRFNVDDPFPDQTGYGLAANLNLLPAPGLIGATLQAGAEAFFLNGDAKWHFPIGLGLALRRPSRGALLKPWIAPRIDLFRNSFATPTQTDTNFGLSGGIDFLARDAIGFTFAVDRVFAGNGFHPTTFSFGARYRVVR